MLSTQLPSYGRAWSFKLIYSVESVHNIQWQKIIQNKCNMWPYYEILILPNATITPWVNVPKLKYGELDSFKGTDK